jgi:hypothetical protein
MTTRDPLVSYAFAFMLLTVGFCVVAVLTVGFCVVAVLSDINKSVKDLAHEIRLQTTQHTWLVEHYTKPVRPILPWEDDK